MAISEVDELKNNKDLSQHFLYTYSHIAKIGPNEKIRRVFNEDLIFDRSRKSIYTQSQEYGYISDTVYSLAIGNENTNDKTYLTLRSYEGTIEFYKYSPLYFKSNVVVLDNTKDEYFNGENVYHVGDTVNVNNLIVTYNGDVDFVYCYTDFINDTTTKRFSINSLSGLNGSFNFMPTFSNVNFTKGENTFYTFARGTSEPAYINEYFDEQHRTLERFKTYTYVWESSISTTVYAYYHTYILSIPHTYWSIIDNPNLVTGNESQVVHIKTTNDYWKSFREDPYICENEHGMTLCLAVEKSQEDRETIYGLVGGTSTEMYRLKTAKLDGNQDYNFYIAKTDNWKGLDLSFQKKNSEEITETFPTEDPTQIYDGYIELKGRKSGEARVWVGNTSRLIYRGNVIPNSLSRVYFPTNKINDGYLDHFIQTGGEGVEMYYVKLSYLGNNYKITNGDYLFQSATHLEEIDFGDVEFANNASCNYILANCTNLNKIVCKQSVKDFLLNNSSEANLPNKFKSGGEGIWEIK